MWSRWKAGQSLHEIGRASGKDHVSLRFMLAQHCGIAPAVWRRLPLTLTLVDREDISRGIACGSSICKIGFGGNLSGAAYGILILNVGMHACRKFDMWLPIRGNSGAGRTLSNIAERQPTKFA